MKQRQKDNNKEEIKRVKKLNQPHDGEKFIPIPEGLIVDLHNIEKIFINENVEYKILKNIDLQIKKGEFIVILGPSGSGKTTLMNIISGLERATNGVVNVLGNDLINFDNTELTTFRRENIGYIFQQYGLLPNLTVKDNILLGDYLKKKNASHFTRVYKKRLSELNKKYKEKIPEEFFILEYSLKQKYQKEMKGMTKVLEINSRNFKKEFDEMKTQFVINNFTENEKNMFLDSFAEQKLAFEQYIGIRERIYEEYMNSINSVEGIDESYFYIENIMTTLQIDKLAKKYPGQLSGGQQQRVSIARTLIKKPKILFADEPTGAVDTEMSKIIMNSLAEINRMIGTTVVIVTHNPAIAQMADRVIHFFDGKISEIIVNENKKTVDEIKWE